MIKFDLTLAHGRAVWLDSQNNLSAILTADLPALQGVFQNLMHPRMRATSTAVTQMVYALIGGGLGPLLVGALSDGFAPDVTPAGSSAGLVAAMAVTAIFYLWAAFHFLRATRHIREELELPL